MKGWPLLRAFLAFSGLLLLGLPLLYFTAPRKPLPLAIIEKKLPEETLTISLTFTKPPEKFSLTYLGDEILNGSETTKFDLQATLQTQFPEEGIDLVFEGTWPEQFQKVGLVIELSRANGTRQSRTVWGSREIFEVFTFSGKEDIQ